MQSVEYKVVSRIYGKGRGWAFSKNDFLDLGRDAAVRKALSHLEEKETIRRVFRGLYDYPQISRFVKGTLGPDPDQVAQALSRKYGWRIQPSENTALNLLGLSTQVPAQAVYLSDGPSKVYQFGNRSLSFRKRSLKESAFGLRESELVVQALKALGKERVDPKVKAQLRRVLPPQVLGKILKDTTTAPGWVHDVIREVANGALS